MDKFVEFLGTTNGIIVLITIAIVAIILMLSGSEMGKDDNGKFYFRGRRSKDKKNKKTNENNTNASPEDLFFRIRQSEKELESNKVTIINKYEKSIELSKTALIVNTINLLLCEYPEMIKDKTKYVDKERDLLELYLERDITEIFSKKLKELYDTPEMKDTTTITSDQLSEKIFNEIKTELKVKSQKYILMETSDLIDNLYKSCERNILELVNDTIKTYISISKNKQKEISDALEEHKNNLRNRILKCENREVTDDK